MTTLLEKAARAVYVENTWDVTGSVRTPPYEEAGFVEKNHARNVVRAVLMSLRESDVALLSSEPGQIGDLYPDLNIGWTVSIDAILSDRQ